MRLLLHNHFSLGCLTSKRSQRRVEDELLDDMKGKRSRWAYGHIINEDGNVYLWTGVRKEGDRNGNSLVTTRGELAAM